jgi:hypothetical protein
MLHPSRFRISGIVAFLTFWLLAGCALLNSVQQPTSIPAIAHTQAAQTLVAQVTLNAPTETPLPTDTQQPGTFTPTPTSVGADTPTSRPVTEIPQAADTEPPTETEEPTPTSGSTQPQPSITVPGDFNLAFQDDFSANSGWYTNQGDDFGFVYTSGGYQIYINTPGFPIWSIRQRDYANLRLEVDITKVEGPSSGYFGVVCRFDQEQRNYYALVISTDGTFAIAKTENNEFEFIQQGTAPSGVIQSGETVNHITADCLGDTLTLSANGQQLLQVQDDDFQSGWIGLIAGTRQEPGLVALFDNFVVLRP